MLKFPWLLFVVCCSVQFVFAQNSQSLRETIFQKGDANGDGFLTRDEMGESNDELYSRLLQLGDENEDGKLSQAEYLKALTPKEPPEDAADRPPARSINDPEDIFQRLDQNGNNNGSLELDELPGPLKERLGPAFTSLGKNSMTVEEFSSAFGVLMKEAREQAGLPGADAFFGHFDKNMDDKVTLEELPEKARPKLKVLFDRLDAEYITREDYEILVERSRRPEPQERRGERPEMAQGRDDDGRDSTRRPGAGDQRRPGPAFFAMLDRDRDGKLSSGELSQAPQLVTQLDRDADGLLDPNELFGFGRRPAERTRSLDGRGQAGPTGRPADRPERPQRPAAGTTPPAAARNAAPQPGPARTEQTDLRTSSHEEFANQLFVRFDGDEDGKLSAEEAPERLRKNFKTLDLDADGAVSKQELTQALASRDR